MMALFRGTLVAQLSAGCHSSTYRMADTEALTYLSASEAPDALRAWAGSRETWSDAWDGCERPEWLVLMATNAGFERAQLVAVACDVIERARRSTQRELPEAWSLAKGWSRGQVDGRTCWAAGFRANTTAKQANDPIGLAAAAAAFACDADADHGYYTSRAHASEAVRIISEHVDASTRDQLIAHIRRRLDGERVRRGLEQMARKETIPPPSAHDDVDEPQPVTPRTLFRIRRA